MGKPEGCFAADFWRNRLDQNMKGPRVHNLINICRKLLLLMRFLKYSARSRRSQTASGLLPRFWSNFILKRIAGFFHGFPK
jgi:hypothetical protein